MIKEINSKLLVNKIFILSFSFVAVPIMITISLLENNDNSLFRILMFFTIWANVFIFIWASVWAINYKYLHRENISEGIENWFFKTIITLFILITGVVANFILVPVWIIVDKPSIKIFFDTIFGALLFQHVLVPIFMVKDFFLTNGSKFKEKQNTFGLIKKTLFSSLVPLIWLCLSFIFISIGILEPQYFFMDFDKTGWNLGINIIILSLICLSWFILFYSLLLYSNEKY